MAAIIKIGRVKTTLGISSLRYNRQLIRENWGEEKQERLYNSKVLIIGGSILGEMALGCLAGLGIGSIIIMSNRKEKWGEKTFLTKGNSEINSRITKNIKPKKIDKIVGAAKKINPYINIIGYNSNFAAFLLDYAKFKPDIIIETENEEFLKEKALAYALKKNINFISAYCNRRKSIISVYNRERQNTDEVLDHKGIIDRDSEQGAIIAGVSAGIITDEVRKSLFQLNNRDNTLEKKIVYNLDSSSRKSLDSDLERRIGDLSEVRSLVVGAGAIGNYVALNLALSGFKKIDIVDHDIVEDTNLNRQILFYELINENKATALSKRIKELGKIRSRDFNYKITENSERFFKENKYDLIFGCMDNPSGRYHLSKFAVDLKIPYIDGGTSDLMGSISTYYPEKTACIKCKKDIKVEPNIRRGCLEALPSVVIPNIIIGSAMVGEAVNLLRGDIFDKMLVYDSFKKDRIYLEKEQKPKEGCLCSN